VKGSLVFPCSVYFTSKLIITINMLRYTTLTLTLMAKGPLWSLVCFAVFGWTVVK